MVTTSREDADLAALARQIKRWAHELGFQQAGISNTDLQQAEGRLEEWLAAGYHGEMSYMARHGSKRSRPALLVPGAKRVISLRMDYLPEPHGSLQRVLDDPARAYISRYALGRDYHKVLRTRLRRLLDKIRDRVGDFGHRVFVDSAPVLEKPLAQQAGLGWIGKHTNLIHREAGSWFFLGEIFTDLPLPTDTPARDHCGTCSACIKICPTGAIVAPYVLDARLCISYLTIELHGPIPLELRPMLGNRIYGCDDCQVVCPWNRFARTSAEPDFVARGGLDTATLSELFAWQEEEFLRRTEGSAIRRIGHLRWLRNIAVALGNAPDADSAQRALRRGAEHPSEMVREHVSWARARQSRRSGPG